MKRRSEVAQEAREKKRAPSIQIPHDPINEVVVIAAAIVDPGGAGATLDSVTADHFFGQGHAIAWATLQNMRRKGLSYDPATLHDLSGGAVDTAAIESYIAQRPKAPPNLKHHIERLRWDRARVDLVNGPLSALLDGLKDPAADPDRVVALARQVPDALSGASDLRYLRATQALVAEQSVDLTARREGRAIYPYGIDGLDYYGDGDATPGAPRMIPGARPKMTTVVVGASGSGKTTTTARIALEQARLGRRTLFGAWEQGAGMTLELIAALDLGWDRSGLMAGEYDATDQRTLEARMLELGEWIRFFELPFGRARGERQFNDKNLDLIQGYIAETRPDVFIADLFRRALKETNPDDEEQALYRMQAITQQEGVHSILINQLKIKELEQREDQRPTRESIKGSSGWVDVADTILGWYRPALSKNVKDTKIQALVLKQRYGKWPIAVEFDWDPSFGSLENGRSIDYDRPGEKNEIDAFLDSKPRRGRR